MIEEADRPIEDEDIGKEEKPVTEEISPDDTSSAIQENSSHIEESKTNVPEVVKEQETMKHVLPPQKYKLKIFIMLLDVFAILIYVYYFMIKSIIQDVANDSFSMVSNRMFSFYCVLGVTIGLCVVVLICKMTHSAMTRFERENQIRQNPNIKVWLVGYDWGWPILFFPTMVLMIIAGLAGLLFNWILSESESLPAIHAVIGGIVVIFGTLNATVVIFKLKPVTLGLILGSFFIVLLVLLLHGADTFLGFFKGFRHLGIKIEPLGYILLAYIWSIFLRVIWFKSLFFYWVFLPNRLELQHGLSESNDSVDREDLRHQIDTDDVILRWWNIGIITYYFPELDKLPITNVLWGIHKKAVYANRIASTKTMQD